MTTDNKIAIKCMEGLPEDAEFIHAFYKEISATIYLVYQHESFDDVVEGGHFITLEPTFEVLE